VHGAANGGHGAATCNNDIRIFLCIKCTFVSVMNM
jgi:hypothetical protein